MLHCVLHNSVNVHEYDSAVVQARWVRALSETGLEQAKSHVIFLLQKLSPVLMISFVQLTFLPAASFHSAMLASQFSWPIMQQ